jgi:hypothetical protein
MMKTVAGHFACGMDSLLNVITYNFLLRSDSFATVDMCRSLKIYTTEVSSQKKEGRGGESAKSLFNESMGMAFSTLHQHFH